MLKDYLRELATYASDFNEAIENAEFHFLSVDTFQNLNVVADKPFSVWATEDVVIFTVNLTKSEGLPFLTYEDIKTRCAGVDYTRICDITPVILFFVDGKYMVKDELLSNTHLDINGIDNVLKLTIYLTDTDIYKI